MENSTGLRDFDVDDQQERIQTEDCQAPAQAFNLQ